MREKDPDSGSFSLASAIELLVAEVEQKLADVDAAIEGVARRAANAGFVYVI